jgi:hypothetical protein
MSIDAAFIGAAAGTVIAILGVIGFWIAWSEKISKANSTAENALQTAAECDEERKELEMRINSLTSDIADVSDRIRREIGETIMAMQKKIHEFETWSRDEFVRKQSLEAMLARTEKAQELRDERLEKRLDRIEKKLDDASAIRSH